MAGKGTVVGADKAVTAAVSDPAAVQAAAISGIKGKASDPASSRSAMAGESVTEMMKRLNLTQKEATPLILDDEDDADLPCPEWALVGKVLAPNTLHVNTISAALKPAWGNPKGLFLRPMGRNLFLAEFGSDADRSRVAKGGPWWMGRHGVLLKNFDVRIQPEDVVFDELPIWARILNLGFELMNDVSGKALAAGLGKVDRLDVDEKGRAWGSYLRARVTIDPSQPLMRCVSAYSQKKKETMIYNVMYERLPVYCFSCGLLGHSSLLCPTPAERDAEGKLPYNGDKLCVPEKKKKEFGMSSDNSQSSRGSWSGTDRGSSSAAADGKKNKSVAQGGETSPVKKRAPRARRETNAGQGKNTEDGITRVSGQKRKPTKLVYQPKASSVAHLVEAQNTLAVVGTQQGSGLPFDATVSEGVLGSDDPNKKQQIFISGSADQAEAGAQPRHPQ
ncbi:hypothetical protein ACQ4PT_060950 [Festuca glaucescens]